MPCTCDGYPTTDYNKEINKLTDMLCGLCSGLENLDELLYVDFLELHPDLKVWWAEHKKIDKEREIREAVEKALDVAIAKAKAKLTPGELLLLGIK